MTEIPKEKQGPDLSISENKTDQSWEREEIGKDEVVTISAGSSNQGAETFGGEVVARFSLGGHSDGSYPTQKIDLISVNWREDVNYQALVRRAQTVGGSLARDISELLLLAHEEGNGITGAAFVPDARISDLGREGTIQWFNYGVDTGVQKGWTPFEDNASISRKQLAFHPRHGTGKLIVIGLTEKSKTEVEAPWVRKEGPR